MSQNSLQSFVQDLVAGLDSAPLTYSERKHILTQAMGVIVGRSSPEPETQAQTVTALAQLIAGYAADPLFVRSFDANR